MKMKEQIFECTSCRMHKLICGALGHKIFIEDKNLARDKKLPKLYSKTLDSIKCLKWYLISTEK